MDYSTFRPVLALALASMAGALVGCMPLDNAPPASPPAPAPVPEAPAPVVEEAVEEYRFEPEAEEAKEPDWAARYAYWRGMALNYFKAPAVGQPVRVKMTSGLEREGVLAEEPTDSVALMVGENMISLPKTVLDTESRLRIFADDYAHYHAMKKVTEEREQHLAECLPQDATQASSATSASLPQQNARTYRVSTEPPRNDSTDASVWQVKEYMKRTMRNYDSVRFMEWSRVLKHEEGYSVRCKYTVHTDSFGRITENKVFFMNHHGNVVRTAAGTQGLRLGELDL